MADMEANALDPALIQASSVNFTEDDFLLVNSDGWTAFHCCAFSNSTKTMHVALTRVRQSGADIEPFITVRDDLERTAVDVALERGHLNSAAEILDILPERGVDGVCVMVSSVANETRQVESLLREGLLAVGSAKKAPWWIASRMSPPATSVTRARSQRLTASPTTFISAGVLEDLERKIDQVIARTGLSGRQSAEAVLSHHRYNVESAIESLLLDVHAALEAAGAPPQMLTGAEEEGLESIESFVTPPAQKLCIICYDTLEGDSCACDALICGHLCCDEDLLRHAEVRLADGHPPDCPFPGCRISLPESVLATLFSTLGDRGVGLLERYQKLRTNKFVQQCDAMKWCPKPGCGLPVKDEGSKGKDKDNAGRCVRCSCGTSFCFACLHIGGHEPCTCDELAKWREALGEMSVNTETSLSEEYLREHTQICPGCGAAIQRTQGCNQMTCRVCSKNFCYVCGRPWEEHRLPGGGFNHYDCSNGPARNAASGDIHLERCRSGFLLNQRDAAQFLGCARIARELWEFFDFEAANLADEVATQLVQARRTLQYCYIWHYYARNDASRYVTWIAELEAITQALEASFDFLQLSALLPNKASSSPTADPFEVEMAALGHNVRRAVARGAAVLRAHTAIVELCTASKLQQQRLCEAASLERRPRAVNSATEVVTNLPAISGHVVSGFHATVTRSLMGLFSYFTAGPSGNGATSSDGCHTDQRLLTE
eukprot:TRINITY_DN21186_c0_g1_i3.p1 TRINITY_DN21186_c0_g1~~TRINITY_DN21186_c0_g1_i3.p1  ORF type:complete len:783 (-),score=141.76 TRINITY_DN21186_c0_g1_i3:267-2420(-)